MESISTQELTDAIQAGTGSGKLVTLRGKDLGKIRTLEVVFQKCEDALQTISELDLAETNLPKIPVSVFRLEQLAVANFSNNRIVSVLEFCRWNALQQLNLSYNQLSVIPVFLFQSTQLRKLVVTGNKLKALPMLPLTLVELDASDNLLTNLGPTFRDLAKLQTCNLSKNKLVTLKPEIFMAGQLPALSSLDVSHNELNDVPRGLGTLESLTALNVGGNPMTNVPDADGLGTGRGADLLAACVSDADAGPTNAATLLRSVKDTDVRETLGGGAEGVATRVKRPDGILDGIMESIHTPGVNPGLIKAGWIVFIILFLFDVGLLIGLGPNLHVAIMFFLTCGVFGSLQWYITMLCELQDERDNEHNNAVATESTDDTMSNKKVD